MLVVVTKGGGMYPEKGENSKQKIIASFVVIFAVIIIGVGITIAEKKQSTSDLVAATTSTTANMTTEAATDTATNSSASTATTSSGSTYKNGSYSATAGYNSPGGTEEITVNITVEGDTVTATSVQQTANNHESAEYQTIFKQNYQSLVVGKKLSAISLSRVSGSSLTSRGFNAALEQIKADAQS